MNQKSLWLIVIALLCSTSSIVPAQNGIVGKIDLDTTLWAPVAYLSVIPDYHQLNTISYENIVERVAVSENGYYTFASEFLDPDSKLYRIHFSKKDDPAASLILGGRDHNHFFLFAEKGVDIYAESKAGSRLFNQLNLDGYLPNERLQEINEMVSLLDTLDYFDSPLNRDFIRDAVEENLRTYADSCQMPLVALYALYRSGLTMSEKEDRRFVKQFLHTWKHEKNAYFQSFRNELMPHRNFSWLMMPILGIIGIIIAMLIALTIRNLWPRKNLLKELSIQERKIFGLLKQGLSNKEISEDCGISVSTVKSHVNNIFFKLKVSSRKEVLDWPE